MRLLIVVLLVFVHYAWAKPDSIEVWFLSADALTSSLKVYFKQSEAVAATDCIPMGDGCFHPQLGYVEEKKGPKNLVQTDRTIPEEGIDLIECDQKDYFNIFCQGKVTESYFPRVEVWIDYSSSLRVLDPSDKEGACRRSAFIRSLMDQCPKNRIDFSIFNTSKKQLGVPEDVCTNYGTNNSKKMIAWIEASNVKKLFIITDIDEYNREFQEYLDSLGATIRGVGVEGLSASKLVESTAAVVASCKKIKAIKK